MPARLDIDARKVAELYEQGFSTPRIGRMFGCSKVPVVRRLRELGIELRGKRICVDVERMAELYEQGFTSRETAQALSCSKSTVLRRLRASGTKLRQKTRELPDLKPSEDLAYVLGVAFGDGKKRSDGLHLQVNDRDFAEAFAKAAENLGFKPRRYFREDEGAYEVCVYSIELGQWFKSLNCDGIKRLLVEEEHKRAFVRGYFDSDGSVTIDFIEKYKNEIRFGDSNLPLLKLMAEVCSSLGIETSIYGPYRRSGERTFPNGRVYAQKESMYVLYVHARSRHRFAELIGSNLVRKRKVLEEITRFYS
jgi:intein-encoded DNA endonuclease-like protein